MYLSRFGVKNYKCLGEIDIPLTPIHVLIGQNDCGKTSLLEAMAAFFCARSEKALRRHLPDAVDVGVNLCAMEVQEPRIDLWGEWARLRVRDCRQRSHQVCHRLSCEFSVASRNLPVLNETAMDRDEIGRQIASFACRRSRLRDGITRSGRTEYRRQCLPTVEVSAVSDVLKPAHKYALNAKLMAVPAGV